MHFNLSIYFISCLLEMTLQEMRLKPDELRSFVIKDTPKYWFTFVIKLLDTNIKMTLLSKKCLLRTNYFDAHRRFMQYSIERTLAFQKISSQLHVHLRKVREKETENQVKVLSGRIYTKELASTALIATSFSARLDLYYYKHKWH